MKTPSHTYPDKEACEFEGGLYSFAYMCDRDVVRHPWNIDFIAAHKSKHFDVSFATVLKSAQQLSLFVDSDPEVLRGTPRIKGTRIPVHRVLNAIEEYGGIAAAVDVYPSLTAEKIQDALRFAANVLESPLEYDDPDID